MIRSSNHIASMVGTELHAELNRAICTMAMTECGTGCCRDEHLEMLAASSSGLRELGI